MFISASGGENWSKGLGCTGRRSCRRVCACGVICAAGVGSRLRRVGSSVNGNWWFAPEKWKSTTKKILHFSRRLSTNKHHFMMQYLIVSNRGIFRRNDSTVQGFSTRAIRWLSQLKTPCWRWDVSFKCFSDKTFAIFGDCISQEDFSVFRRELLVYFDDYWLCTFQEDCMAFFWRGLFVFFCDWRTHSSVSCRRREALRNDDEDWGTLTALLHRLARTSDRTRLVRSGPHRTGILCMSVIRVALSRPVFWAGAAVHWWLLSSRDRTILFDTSPVPDEFPSSN